VGINSHKSAELYGICWIVNKYGWVTNKEGN